jgi:hypothetical protein
MKKLLLVLSVPALWVAAPAYAHFNLDAPPPSITSDDGGMGSPPCSVGPASGVITPAQGGHPLTVMVDEFVPHTGFYRMALAINSLSELPVDNVVKDASGKILPPSGKPSGTSASAEYEAPPVFPVLQDHVFVHQGTMPQTFQMDITLPNINCDRCTLQVIEFMQGHPFNTASPPDTGPGGGYFYHHCADLKITADPSLPLFTPGAGGSSAGGSTSLSGGAGGATSSVGGAGGVNAAGGSGQMSAAGASVGGAATGAGGVSVSAGGAGVTGSAGADSPASADSGGCSCSLGRRSAASKSFAALLLGLLLVARRRAARASALPRELRG